MKILTARQEVKNNMYNVVIVKYDANTDIIGANAALMAALTEFKAIVANIAAASQVSSVVTTGIAADKKVSKNDLSQIAAITAGQIFAYAAKIKNITLKNSVDFSASDLSRSKDGELVPRCQAIHDLGGEHQAVLADYGVTTHKLQDVQNAIDTYAQSVPKPRSAIADRSTLKADIKQYFKDADTLLKEQMDKLVEALIKDHPGFVQTYKNARIIVDPKTKSKSNGNGENGTSNTPA